MGRIDSGESIMPGWFWGGGGGSEPVAELPIIFPLEFTRDQFVEIDILNIYQKILTEVIERTQGIEGDQYSLLWDNCIQSEASLGLISRLARAMAFRRNLFLVYEPALNVLREADSQEKEQIIQDYKKQGESSVGVYISFQYFLKSDLVRLYSALEYITIASLHKSMNLSAAIQFKMSDMRGSTGVVDSRDVIDQAKKIAKSLGCGKDVLLDAKDVLETAVPNLTAIEASINYLSEKKAFYLGLPRSYITGEQTAGIGSTGESDVKAVERGLKNYYESIIKPVLQKLFGIETSYKSQDFRMIDQGLNALKTFALTDETLISAENKTLIINKLFDLPEDSEGDQTPADDQGALKSDQIGMNATSPQV